MARASDRLAVSLAERPRSCTARKMGAALVSIVTFLASERTRTMSTSGAAVFSRRLDGGGGRFIPVSFAQGAKRPPPRRKRRGRRGCYAPPRTLGARGLSFGYRAQSFRRTAQE